ncbi:hypothetical protein PGTUg99_032414 [Puccinia graminis f. sp. tritici]|uniref:HAT C-terminal dimerisation domain-containing protein n=1 Tax=Puccinia graminis f. sp. tritici TaxID=56615 RepID=A0A5B0NHM3_PUCGR|nr:hypothetical protein PGTUg99_032414 [Puccinia graminis f. sp. tritici]
MASCYLGIPATSAPSKQVFSRSKTIIGPQRHSLSSSAIKHLLCVKEWYQKFDKMMDTSTVVNHETLKKNSEEDIDGNDDNDEEDTDDDDENEDHVDVDND